MAQDTDPDIPVRLTRRVRVYLRMCARELIDDHENNDVTALVERRNWVWSRMTKEERAATNTLVGHLFGRWY